MRVLHVINHTCRFNGNVHAAIDLVCAQADAGCSTAIANAGGDFDAPLAAHGVEPFVWRPLTSPLGAPRSAAALAALMRQWKPDLVHAHMVSSALLAAPGCWTSNTPLVTTVHNAHERTAVLMAVGERVIAVSQEVQSSLQRRGVSASRLRTVLNGTIGSARHAGCAPPRIALQQPSILYVGGLHPRKGVADLIKAFDVVHRSIPKARLYLVGEGPSEGDYRDLARALVSGPAIEFCGSSEDPRPYLRSADVFVLASHADPAPLVLSEAREAGCAMVGTSVGGIPELLEFGAAGVLVPSNSPGPLAQALIEMLGKTGELVAWRERSQHNIQKLSVARVAQETIAVYRECLTPRRLARANQRAATMAPTCYRPVDNDATRVDAPVIIRPPSPASRVPLRVGVVIATANRPGVVPFLLEALKKQTLPPERTVVSCCARSDLGQANIEGDVEAVFGEPGLTRQRNRGVRRLGEDVDIVVFFDDDFIPHDGWIETAERTFRDFHDVVAFTGRVLADGIKGPGLSLEYAQELLAAWDASRIGSIENNFSPYGCNMAFRRSAIANLAFDERLVLYGWLEDRDFGGALRKRGGRLIRSPETCGVHLGAKSGRLPGRRLGYSQIVNPVYLMHKGTMTPSSVATHIFKNLASNLVLSFASEPYVDRIGRLRGNLIGLADVARGRLTPERAGHL